MTEGEILALPPGNELNIRVVEEVMGYKHVVDAFFGDIQIDDQGIWTTLVDYSEDESKIPEILQRLEQRFLTRIDIECFKGSWQADLNIDGDGVNYYYPDFNAFSLPEAICKAALLTAQAEKCAQPV